MAPTPRGQNETSQCDPNASAGAERLSSMNIMSTGNPAPTPRRRARIAASILAAALLFAGCSAGDSADSAASDSDWDTAQTEADWDASAGDWDVGADASASESGTEDRGWEEPPESDRDVVITGSLYITVEDPTDAAASATRIVRDAGGRIDGRSETAPDDYSDGEAWLILRIPAGALDATVAQLRELGTVDEYRTDTYDVTNQVKDLDAQISTLRSSTARIQSLLNQAEDISDIIKLEDELAERQGRLEGLEARQRGLDDQVSMSTIELSLTTEPVVEVEEESPSSFWDGLVAGWNGLVSFFNGFLVVLGVLLPWLVLMAIITLAIILAVRLTKKRNPRRPAVTPHAARPAQPAPEGSTPSAQTPPDAPDVFDTPPRN